MCDRSHLSAIDSRARRAARRFGWQVIKKRGKLPPHLEGCGYMLIDERRACIAGSWFELAAEDIIRICKAQAAALCNAGAER
jgi:hypothetical protein